MKSRMVIFSLAALCVLLTGCGPLGERTLTGSGMDMFAPVAMRIHPLTRVVADDAKENVEIHIELKDQFGDVGKGVGTISLDLYAYALLGLGNRGERLASWSGDISTPPLNKQYWDPITRTYVFRFRADPVMLRARSKWVLSAAMTFPNHTELKDEFTLETK